PIVRFICLIKTNMLFLSRLSHSDYYGTHRDLPSFPTRRSSDLGSRLHHLDALAIPHVHMKPGRRVCHVLQARDRRKVIWSRQNALKRFLRRHVAEFAVRRPAELMLRETRSYGRLSAS